MFSGRHQGIKKIIFNKQERKKAKKNIMTGMVSNRFMKKFKKIWIKKNCDSYVRAMVLIESILRNKMTKSGILTLGGTVMNIEIVFKALCCIHN